MDCRVYGGLVLGQLWTEEYTEDLYCVCGDCKVYVGLVLGLQWTVEYTENRYWFCSGLWSVRRTGNESIVDC